MVPSWWVALALALEVEWVLSEGNGGGNEKIRRDMYKMLN